MLLVDLAGIALEQQLHVAVDRRQRRAQLVRDGGDEVVLHPVEVPEAIVLLGEQPATRLGLFEQHAVPTLALVEIVLALR